MHDGRRDLFIYYYDSALVVKISFATGWKNHDLPLPVYGDRDLTVWLVVDGLEATGSSMDWFVWSH